MNFRPARIGIIGCGAVTSVCHLPAARRVREVEVVALADPNLARAAMLGQRFGVARIGADYHEFLGDVDGAIVATPHALHAPIAGELLERGLPVLVEKPFTTTTEEATRLIEIARLRGAPLQVGHMLRFSKGARLVKRILAEGWLGPLQRFSLESGGIYSWPIASGFFWKREQAGGGVLIDTGSHMLDLLLWWLGDMVDVEYRDDNLGGIEADCWLSLTLQGPTGQVSGEVTLSRLRRLRGAAQIVGAHFSLEYGLSGPYQVRIWPTRWTAEAGRFVSDFAGAPPDTFDSLFDEQLRAFAATIRDGAPPAVPAESALHTVALIERCYRERKPLEQPWLRTAALA